jgi:hypothetical protein
MPRPSEHQDARTRARAGEEVKLIEAAREFGGGTPRRGVVKMSGESG